MELRWVWLFFYSKTPTQSQFVLRGAKKKESVDAVDHLKFKTREIASKMCYSDVSKMSLDKEVDVVANWDFCHNNKKTEPREHKSRSITALTQVSTAKKATNSEAKEFRDVWLTLKIFEATKRIATHDDRERGSVWSPCKNRLFIHSSIGERNVCCALGRLMRRAATIEEAIKNASFNHYQIILCRSHFIVQQLNISIFCHTENHLFLWGREKY